MSGNVVLLPHPPLTPPPQRGHREDFINQKSLYMVLLLTIREHLGLPLVFWWGLCCSFFFKVSCGEGYFYSFFFFFFFAYVLCLVCPVLLVSLDWPLMIAHTVFSNVYLPFHILWFHPQLFWNIAYFSFILLFFSKFELVMILICCIMILITISCNSDISIQYLLAMCKTFVTVGFPIFSTNRTVYSRTNTLLRTGTFLFTFYFGIPVIDINSIYQFNVSCITCFGTEKTTYTDV